jgi:hypothetical protein
MLPSLFIRAPIPSMRLCPHNLLTSQRPRLLILPTSDEVPTHELGGLSRHSAMAFTESLVHVEMKHPNPIFTILLSKRKVKMEYT